MVPMVVLVRLFGAEAVETSMLDVVATRVVDTPAEKHMFRETATVVTSVTMVANDLMSTELQLTT